MKSTDYNVIFHGEIAEGQHLATVKKRLSSMFKLSKQQIEETFAGKPLLVKDHVDYQTALKYKAAFEKAGVVCLIEPVPPRPHIKTSPAPKADLQPTEGQSQGKRYQVIFRGEIVDGYETAKVKRNLARLFKADVKRIEPLFSGQPVVIKEDLDAQTAETYQKKIKEAGAICVIQQRDSAVQSVPSPRKVSEEQFQTQLFKAVEDDKPDAIRRLLEQGARHNSKDENGNTPLHNAALNKHIACCKALIEGGADSYAKNEAGQTPFQYAEEFLKLHASAMGATFGGMMGDFAAQSAREDIEQLRTVLTAKNRTNGGTATQPKAQETVQKVPCRNCGAMILPRTADKNDGLCMPCSRGERSGTGSNRHRQPLSESRPAPTPSHQGAEVEQGNFKPGQKVPKTGTYQCIFCGPDGMGANVLKIAARSMGIPYQPPPGTLKPPTQKFFKAGQRFTSCPTCKHHPSGSDPTGWCFLSEQEIKQKTAPNAGENQGCFIATACYGSTNCIEVLILRKFRDETLLQRQWGKILVSLYYRYSPPLAARIRHHPLIKRLIRRFVMTPIVRLILHC